MEAAREQGKVEESAQAVHLRCALIPNVPCLALQGSIRR